MNKNSLKCIGMYTTLLFIGYPCRELKCTYGNTNDVIFY